MHLSLYNKSLCHRLSNASEISENNVLMFYQCTQCSHVLKKKPKQIHLKEMSVNVKNKLFLLIFTRLLLQRKILHISQPLHVHGQ